MGYQWHDPRDEGTGKIQQVYWKVNTGQEKTEVHEKESTCPFRALFGMFEKYWRVHI